MNHFSNKRILGKPEAFSRPDDLSWATDRRKKGGGGEKKTFQSSPPFFFTSFSAKKSLRAGEAILPCQPFRSGGGHIRWRGGNFLIEEGGDFFSALPVTPLPRL